MKEKPTATGKGQYGDFVRAARLALGWTQVQLGEHFGRTKANISGWEKNRHEPSAAQLHELARLSGVPIPGVEPQAHQPRAIYDVTESADVQRLIMAFGWLTEEQQRHALADLEAKAETNKAISRQLGPRWEFKPDEHVARHIEPAPRHTVPITRKKKPGGPSRNIGDVLGDFQTDD